MIAALECRIKGITMRCTGPGFARALKASADLGVCPGRMIEHENTRYHMPNRRVL